MILIRAMVAAAKADGQVTSEEQNAILQQLGNQAQEVIQFLRSEFARSTSARDLAWTVPLGMEDQVYAISLMGMNLDTQEEAEYLAELAQGLRLPPATCNQIHDRYRVPRIFNPS